MPEDERTVDDVLRLLVEQVAGTTDSNDAARQFAGQGYSNVRIPADVVAALQRLFPAGASPSAQPEGQPPLLSTLRRAFRLSAAVLAAFEPQELQPSGEQAPSGTAPAELAGDLAPAHTDDSRDLWMLRPDAREQALQGRSRPELVEALDANPDRSKDPLQLTLDALIRGTAKALGEQTPDELTRTLQAVRWLQPTELPLPAPASIHELMEAKRIVAGFEDLAENFVGRKQKLKLLSDYVGVLEPSSAIEGVRRTLRQRFDQREKPPFVMHAAGGAGKSTLVAKFLLNHLNLPEDQRFPYVYLDSGNPTLVLDEPLTILREAARQLATQYPSGQGNLQEFVAAAEAELRDAAGLDQALDPGGLEASRQAAVHERRYAKLYGDFARVVLDIVKRSDDKGDFLLPLLLVLDTYEDVQSRGIDDELRLWSLLDSLRSDFHSLRVVVFGRAPLERVPTTGRKLRSRPLGPLSAIEAETLLDKAGVKDRSVARTLYQDLGGNPLNLKLAAAAYLAEQESGSGRTGVEGLGKSRLLLFEAQENVVQGQLYQRILQHIPSPDVRRLAHPGLVLRRVTPGLIKEVLQVPCRVPVPDDERAMELFAELAKVVALVTEEPDGALLHRPYVRRVMLKLIERDSPEQVAEINRLAVQYYELHSELTPPAQARAEELYHRLQLAQTPAQIEQRWTDAAAPYLRDTLNEDELPVASQVVLGALLGVRLPERVLRAADMDQWEHYTARAVAEAIETGHYDAAHRALQGRARRRWSSSSPLHVLEARLHLLERRPAQAETALRRAMAAADRSHRRSQILDTFVVGSQVADAQGDRATADERLVGAQKLTVLLKDPIRQIEIALRRLRLRQAPDSDLADSTELRHRLAELLTELPDQDWLAHESLVRQGVLGLGFERPDLLLRLVRRLGAARLNTAQRQRLAQLLAKVVELVELAQDRLQAFARTVGLSEPDGSPSSLENLLLGIEDAGRLVQLYEELIPLVFANPESRELGTSILPHLFAESPEVKA